MLGEFDRQPGFVVADLEAGVGTLSRLPQGATDVIISVTEPSLKSIEVAKKVAAGVNERHAASQTISAANKISSPEDLALIEEHLPDPQVVIPWDESVSASDRAGVSPLDKDSGSPAVAAIAELADLLESRTTVPA